MIYLSVHTEQIWGISTEFLFRQQFSSFGLLQFVVNSTNRTWDKMEKNI